MCQIDDSNFKALLQCARAGFLTNVNITNLNNKITIDFPFDNLLKNTLIV